MIKAAELSNFLCRTRNTYCELIICKYTIPTDETQSECNTIELHSL